MTNTKPRGKIQVALERIYEIVDLIETNDPDKLQLLNTEAEFEPLVEWALRTRNEALAQATSCKTLEGLYAHRKRSYENKADHMKNIVEVLMSAADEKSYKGISGTVSVKKNADKIIVDDESKVPDDYFVETRTLSKSTINQAIKDGYTVSGVRVEDGGESLTIRVK